MRHLALTLTLTCLLAGCSKRSTPETLSWESGVTLKALEQIQSHYLHELGNTGRYSSWPLELPMDAHDGVLQAHARCRSLLITLDRQSTKVGDWRWVEQERYRILRQAVAETRASMVQQLGSKTDFSTDRDWMLTYTTVRKQYGL